MRGFTCKSSKISLHLCWSWLLLTITTILLYCLVFRSSFMSLLNKMPFASMLYWHSNNISINCLCKHIFIYLSILWIYGFFSHAGIAFLFIHKISTVLTVESSQLSDAQNVIFTHISRDFVLSRLASPIVIYWHWLRAPRCVAHNWLLSLSLSAPRCVLVTRPAPAPQLTGVRSGRQHLMIQLTRRWLGISRFRLY